MDGCPHQGRPSSYGEVQQFTLRKDLPSGVISASLSSTWLYPGLPNIVLHFFILNPTHQDVDGTADVPLDPATRLDE